MSDLEDKSASENPPPAGRMERKPWSRPMLTMRSIEDVTHGTKASTNVDATMRLTYS